MKVLLAILSCARDAPLEVLQRQTFLRNTTWDYKFFHGLVSSDTADTVSLAVEDDFWSLPFKTQAMCRWAVEQGYDYVFKCDTDTYVRLERLRDSHFANHEYIGYFSYPEGPGAYASGGSGYWLSRRAMQIVAESTAFFLDSHNPVNTEPSFRGEDLQVCWALQEHGIHCHKDTRYCLRSPGPLPKNNLITVHDVLIGNKRARVESAHHAWVAAGGQR